MVSYADTGGKISICYKIRENIGKKFLHGANNGKGFFVCGFVLDDIRCFS
jgi:hypothetical protein